MPKLRGRDSPFCAHRAPHAWGPGRRHFDTFANPGRTTRVSYCADIPPLSPNSLPRGRGGWPPNAPWTSFCLSFIFLLFIFNFYFVFCIPYVPFYLKTPKRLPLGSGTTAVPSLPQCQSLRKFMTESWGWLCNSPFYYSFTPNN